MKTGALIIASLNSDRTCKGTEEMTPFLPMLSAGGTTMVKREIATLRKAGVSPILVLCGYQKDLLKNHLSHNSVIFFEDENFSIHSQEESTALGLSFASGLCDRILVVPVETPVFSADTVKRLLACETNAAPVFQGRMGYPRLVYFSEMADIPSASPVKTSSLSFSPIQVEDPGILCSLIDTDGPEHVQAYIKMLRDTNDLRLKLKVTLTKEEDFFGPGTWQLLSLIDQTGSIQSAAAAMKMSYSKSWKMINRLEQQMGFAFLNRCNGGKNGGNSTLTEQGKIFIDKYHALTEDLNKIARNFFDIYFQDFQ